MAWLCTWGILWFSVFMAMWWIEVVCLSNISAAIYALIVAVLFYYFQLYLPQWVHTYIV
ncbi:hypothetical protein PT286_08455 [Neisseriaceae bacterium ESL0693]|nr:hypothetical protein [Neisseriaceae bacterium ESL0693]